MVKKALTLLTSILIALPLLMPFNIYADTITNSNVLGINTILLSKSQNVDNTNSWYYLYQHTITLDADYIGTITLDINLTYINPSGSSTQYNTATISNKSYFVNGNSIIINQLVSSDNFGNQGPFVTSSYLLKSSNVLKTSTITELQQIIDLLSDIYDSNDNVEGLLNNQLEQLEQIVTNTNLANQYLEDISNIRSWNLPYESLRAVFSTLYYNKPIDIYSNSYINNYPVFKFPSSDNKVMRLYAGRDTVLISINKGGSLSSLNNYFELNNENVTFKSCEILETIFYEIEGNKGYFYVNKITFNTTENTHYNTDLIYKNSAISYFVPIFFGANLDNVSVDFALRYRLSNRLLDDINLIANGTTASQSAAQSSDNANSQLQTDSNTLFQQENGFKSDMQNAMQNVNNTFRLQDMGAKFVSSAQWVRTQYENLTNNTPFASLITFSLITGLALILLGKVYK